MGSISSDPIIIDLGLYRNEFRPCKQTKFVNINKNSNSNIDIK